MRSALVGVPLASRGFMAVLLLAAEFAKKGSPAGQANALPKQGGALMRDPFHDWAIRLRLSTKARKTLFIRV